MLAPWLALHLFGTASPELSLVELDARGCGRPALVAGGRAEPLLGGPSELCIRQLEGLALEGGEPGAALLVTRPGTNAGLFVYRLQGRRLVPRFLGSGFASLELVRLLPTEGGGLRLEARAEDGALTMLGCGFVGFPLHCEILP